VGSLDDLIRDLRKFEDRKTVVRELRREIRKPVPAVRREIRQRALDWLPRRGGLNRWVSRISITAKVRLSGRSAGIQLKGGRNSAGARADIRAIDRGKVRAPTYGHRGRRAWHNQTVPDGFFSHPATSTPAWRAACLAAVDKALATIRRGR
jgi:hypothetical protein